MLKCTSGSGAHVFWEDSQTCHNCKVTKKQIGCKHDWVAKSLAQDLYMCSKCKFHITGEKLAKMTGQGITNPHSYAQGLFQFMSESAHFKEKLDNYVAQVAPKGPTTYVQLPAPWPCHSGNFHTWMGLANGKAECFKCGGTCSHFGVKLHTTCPTCDLKIVQPVVGQCQHHWALTKDQQTLQTILMCTSCGVDNACKNHYFLADPQQCKYCGAPAQLVHQQMLAGDKQAQAVLANLPKTPARIKAAKLLPFDDFASTSSKFKNTNHAILHTIAELMEQLQTDGVQSFATMIVKNTSSHDGLVIEVSVASKARPEDW